MASDLRTQDRKSSYKLPPSHSSLISPQSSQAARREKALADQKRKRAAKFNLSRNIDQQLDAFASLTLAGSNSNADIDEEDEEQQDLLAENPRPDGIKVVHSGLASFTDALKDTDAEQPSASSSKSKPNSKIKKQQKKTNSKSKSKSRVAGNASANSQWADKCMYAELLEMSLDESMTGDNGQQVNDNLPPDLYTSWVALSPVPIGKRCLAITRDGPGYNSTVDSNMTLRSRVLGKPLIQWFPSSLPPRTVLDCILDANWRSNGVLHVLDVMKWKGQDVGDCEAGFRFWWRDTRLNELSSLAPPSNSSSTSASAYTFSYPTTLLPVPYHASPLTLSTLLSTVIPSARSARTVDVRIGETTSGGDMDVDRTQSTTSTTIQPDGLLLYVSEASYEPGTSPLSSWIPLRGDSGVGSMDLFEQ
ncbi:hypothetical protein BT96DRAFT_176875 [Gymnopus androsaceus JB14]|uniref:Snurportin-1 n=1 Tax=Gymnopus androsaceus JB14 TaxID=1447944 RepID=A0A6A4IBC5_9AGAR|nr:hypothetical protein BT96DRAFT_176875 [Gymnopus androsaceus JB14]